MPPGDSERLKNTEDAQEPLRESASFAATGDEIVTPIEAEAEEEAEREFHTERKIAPSCRTAIISVNGEDVDKVPLESQDRAA